MRYTVEFTRTADQNIHDAYDWIASDSLVAADRWLIKLLEAIDTLTTFPLRCSIAPETSIHPLEIRELFFGRYRILFAIERKSVFVLSVRHSARRPATPEEL